jgi:hypothetical protein
MNARLRLSTAVASAAAVGLLGAGGLLAAGSSSASVTDDNVAVATAARAGCQAWLVAHPGSNTSQATRMRNCVADQTAIIAALTAPSPTPSATPSTSPSASPTVTAEPTTAPPATTPPASPTPSVTPTGAVTHGSQISPANTGYLAWVGPAGQRCTDAVLKVYTAKVNASTLNAAGATCVWLKAGLNVDVPITLTAARIDVVVRSDGPRLQLNWSTVDGHGDGTYTIGGHNVGATRSQIVGSSDGVRFEQMDLVEDWIRTFSASSADHNDGIQAYQASAGGTILRCNISSRPVNLLDSAGVYGTAPIFLADNSRGTTEIRDNYLAGGNYTLRLHESMSYRVTGNVIVDKSWNPGTGPVSTTNAVPGAFLEWDNNTTTAGAVLNP